MFAPYYNNYIVLDIDVSVLDNSDTKKEGVTPTYKRNVYGYAPIMAYMGEEGYLVNAELRAGKAHSQCDKGQFIADSIDYAKRITSRPLLLRMDAAHDSADTYRICRDKGVDWIVKGNIHNKEEALLSLALSEGELSCPREGKRVWRGSTISVRGGMEVRMVY